MDIREHICIAGKILFERKLTDLAGGNISVRDGEMIYMTPRYSGSRFHWNLSPENIVVGRLEGEEIGDGIGDGIASNPNFSREGWSHLELYRHYPDIQAVVHAHAFYAQPFASLCMPIEPVLEANDKFGVVQVIEPAPAHSRELADKVVAGFVGQEERIRKFAAVVIIPRHGLIAGGKDLHLTLDTIERVNTNAYCILARKMLGAG
jgi:L-fuculose-phosphate aldolase